MLVAFISQPSFSTSISKMIAGRGKELWGIRSIKETASPSQYQRQCWTQSKLDANQLSWTPFSTSATHWFIHNEVSRHIRGKPIPSGLIATNFLKHKPMPTPMIFRHHLSSSSPPRGAALPPLPHARCKALSECVSAVGFTQSLNGFVHFSTAVACVFEIPYKRLPAGNSHSVHTTRLAS